MNDIQKRILLVFLLVCGAFFLTFNYVTDRYFDSTDYYVTQGTEGPFKVREVRDGVVTLENTVIETAHPGEMIGWITTSCFLQKVSGSFVSQLVRLSDRVPVAYNTGDRDFTKCGSSIGRMNIPKEAVPGDYIVQRTILLKPKGLPPISTDIFPLIHIKIVN